MPFTLVWPDGTRSFQTHASAERWAITHLGPNSLWAISKEGDCC